VSAEQGAASPAIAPSRSRLFVGLFVLFMGLVITVPNAWPLIQHAIASRSEPVTARWVESHITSSSRDTVGVPNFAFERRIGPIVQECRVALTRYRHAPNGRPLRETLRVVPGTTCDDLVVLDDPPRERIPLVLLGLMVAAAGAVLTTIAVRRRPA
jgi:hypothetical protein